MIFNVIDWDQKSQFKLPSTVQLRIDKWDDFGFKTQFHVVYIDESLNEHKVGDVKIGQFQKVNIVGEPQYSPILPNSFEYLEDEYYSIGQSENYYLRLNHLGEEVRDAILIGLQDLAKNPKNLERALSENMMQTSLLRSVGLQSIKGRFHRLAIGDTKLTKYNFKCVSHDQLTLSFEVLPYTEPPTNIHVLIGRNGVGKTYLLNQMTLSLLSKNSLPETYNIMISDEANEDEELFANLISVSFSAFDPFNPIPPNNSQSNQIPYSYIGLKKFNNKTQQWDESPKHLFDLIHEFVTSIENCFVNGKLSQLKNTIEILNSDPIFEAIRIIDVLENGEEINIFENKRLKGKHAPTIEWYENLTKLYSALSSGHKIVLLTLIRLVETVVERTLILIDEPEAHLHPPLLSAFIRALSDLLMKKNGVAIIATHSPVVIQEVPKNCVWKLRRSGSITKADRPTIETFGENVGVLTRDIFGLEVTNSGFHKMLSDAVQAYDDYESVMKHFDNQLGTEAKAIVQGLLLNK